MSWSVVVVGWVEVDDEVVVPSFVVEVVDVVDVVAADNVVVVAGNPQVPVQPDGILVSE